GRYAFYQPRGETRPIWTNNQDSRDLVTAENGQTQCTDMATIWRWRQHFQHDFAARMDWCVATTYRQANHNPIAILNGDTSKRVIEMNVKAGETVKLSSKGSKDPDDQLFSVSWWVYAEAGTYTGEIKLGTLKGEETSFVAPKLDKSATVHVIMQVQDEGTPSLFAYRRAIVTIEP
ncbi:MAG: hypothetical protein MUC97_10685, partial [Bernardetiaceae bacterium]|nr:hypothetical protein [Bernardetiaceae bacterium]